MCSAINTCPLSVKLQVSSLAVRVRSILEFLLVSSVEFVGLKILIVPLIGQ